MTEARLLDDGSLPMSVRYQTVCTRVTRGEEMYHTYGLLCLMNVVGKWVLMDRIEDVSLSQDSVLALADRFTELQLSPLHFRDAVLDSVNE